MTRVNVTKRRAAVPGRDEQMQFATARVDAGPRLGNVTAVLNGAVVTGAQEALSV